MWWTALIKPISEALGTWQQNRKEVKQAKHEATIARIKDQSSSWKDEFLVVVWSYPAISSFIPGLQDATTKGFKNLGLLPEWYVAGWIAISLSVFGITKLAQVKMKS